MFLLSSCSSNSYDTLETRLNAVNDRFTQLKNIKNENLNQLYSYRAHFDIEINNQKTQLDDQIKLLDDSAANFINQFNDIYTSTQQKLLIPYKTIPSMITEPENTDSFVLFINKNNPDFTEDGYIKNIYIGILKETGASSEYNFLILNGTDITKPLVTSTDSEVLAPVVSDFDLYEGFKLQLPDNLFSENSTFLIIAINNETGSVNYRKIKKTP